MIEFPALVLLSLGPVVSVKEPSAASPWVQSVRASCGASELLIAGYGAAKPLGRIPKILVSGRPVTGRALNQLQADLSYRRAAYRLEILCGNLGGITLRINIGEKQLDGTVQFQSGAAFMKGNRLVSYTGLQIGDADSFWFR